MFLKALSILIFLICSCSIPGISQTNNIDTPKLEAQSNLNYSHIETREDEEFNLFLFLFAASALSLIAGFSMIGIAIALLLLFFILLLVVTGIISTSVFIGYINQSHMSGIKSLFVIVGGLCGLIAGTVSFGFISLLFKISLTKTTIIISGATTGLIAGILCSYIIYRIIKLVGRLVVNKWKVFTKPA